MMQGMIRRLLRLFRRNKPPPFRVLSLEEMKRLLGEVEGLRAISTPDCEERQSRLAEKAKDK
jgi:hypothetical protein